jgi:hypothetical protein
MSPRTTPMTMKMSTLTRTLPAAALLAVLASGCAEYPIFDSKPARNGDHPKAVAVIDRSANQPARPKERSRERERDRDEGPKEADGLRDGIRLYNEGDYNGAIKRLGARDLNNGPLATRLAALKYTAFSYCVTARPAQCRQAFDKALRLDPSFDLAPGEHGHPLWGPVFTKAKQAAD